MKVQLNQKLKWKIYLSGGLKRMNKHLSNERGLSLVELLATLAIGSLIVIFIMSVHILIQKQYSIQSKDIQHLTDITIAAKAITKDLRVATQVEVNEDKDLITITEESGDEI